MSIQQELIHKYSEVRRELRNSPKAVVDHGINLSRYYVKPPLMLLSEAKKQPEKTEYAEIKFNPVRHLRAGQNSFPKFTPIRRCSFIHQSEPPLVWTVRVDEILHFVSSVYQISMVELISDCRTQAMARPRQIAMWLCKKLTTKSLVFIGKRMNGRDHTTVLHGVRRIEHIASKDPLLKADLEAFLSVLRPVEPKDESNAEENQFGLPA